MKLKSVKTLLSKIPGTAVNVLVLCLCVYASNTRCGWLLHQPEMPREIKRFRRF